MPDIYVRGIPVKLHLKMKKAAKAHKRSMNSEVIFRLEEAYQLRPVETAAAKGTARTTLPKKG